LPPVVRLAGAQRDWLTARQEQVWEAVLEEPSVALMALQRLVLVAARLPSGKTLLEESSVARSLMPMALPRLVATGSVTPRAACRGARRELF
jgi:hypothetical protein